MRWDKDRKLKTHCCECGSPIYDNVDPSREVVCANCTQILLLRPRRRPEVKKKPNDLVAYRLSKGYSKKTMAEILGISRQHYHRMEAGQNDLNKTALRLLNKRKV